MLATADNVVPLKRVAKLTIAYDGAGLSAIRRESGGRKFGEIALWAVWLLNMPRFIQ